jgi:hypothetical protein
MSRAAKVFERMERNPQGGFTIEDVQLVCRTDGVGCRPPSSGSHYTVSHASQPDILTVPYKRPIKPVYIRLLVAYILRVRASANNG